MTKMKLNKWVIVISIIIILLLNGCTMGGQEIDSLGIAISMGIDKVGGEYLLTFQIINPKAIAAQDSVAESPVVIYTKTGKDIYEAIRNITPQSPRKVYTSHLRTLILGEEIAEEGIEEILDFVLSHREFRTDFYFIIAKGTTANNIMNVITPLESVPGIEMYHSLELSGELWAPIKATKVIELTNDIIADGKSPVLPSIKILEPVNESSSTIEQLQRIDPNKLKLSELGAFRGDRLIGWLTEDESKGYNYITGNVTSTVAYLHFDEENKITYEGFNSKSNIKAVMLNDEIQISVEVEVIANIISQEGEVELYLEENIAKLKQIIEERIILLCNLAIQRAQEDFESDIFGFGEVIHRTYPKQWKEIKDDWNREFVNLPVTITVDMELNNLGESIRSVFTKGKF